jgi:hypothetical protein
MFWIPGNPPQSPFRKGGSKEGNDAGGIESKNESFIITSEVWGRGSNLYS